MNLRHVPLIVSATLCFGILAAYAASAAEGHVPACVPHFTGCASVSASGRHGTGFFLFKATAMPAAALFAVYWAIASEWLRAGGERSHGWRRAMLGCGFVGATALIVYTAFLGSEGEGYRLARRYGTVLFFGFTYLAQLLLVYRARAWLGDTRLVKAKVALCLAALIEGLLLEALTYFVPDDAWAENLVEWHVATMISLYPVLTWLMWRQTGFRVTFRL